MKIVFRTDSSLKMGAGHLMRCLTLADELSSQNHQITFICRNLMGNLITLIKQKNYKVITIPIVQKFTTNNVYLDWLGATQEYDSEQTISVLPKNIDLLIVDSYALDEVWHLRLRKFTKIIMVIDDLADRSFDCDILLNQNLGAQIKDYKGKVPNDCELVLGCNYALLRPEFSKLRLKAIEKRESSKSIKRILVSMGSMDPNNLTSQVLAGLAKVEWEEQPVVDVVLGSRAPKFKTIVDQSKNYIFDLNVLQDIENMSELMLEADLAIGAGGTTSWERCCLGLPTLVVQLADNQKQVIVELVGAGAARSISYKDIESDIIQECNSLQKNNIAMSEISKNAFKVVNGQGAQLLAIKMKPDLAQDGSYVTIRNANTNDADIIYKWQLDATTRKYFHDTYVPEYDKHIKWFEKKLAEPKSFFYIIEHNNQAAGVLRLDYQDNIKKNTYIVSIYISPDKCQQGLGSIALGYMDRLFDSSELHAEILEDNIASKKLFMKSGYIRSNKQDLYIKHPEQKRSIS